MHREGRAGPEREFEKRKEVGFGRTPSHPLAASLQDDVRPLAQPWLPGAKLTRSGKAWVGVGMGSASGRRAGGGRNTHRKMLRELAGHVDSRSEDSVAPSASCGASWVGERRQGGEEGGHPIKQARPSPHHLPHLHRLPFLHKAYAFPRQGPAQCLATRCSVPGSEFQGIDSVAVSGGLAFRGEHCSLSGPALAWPSMLPSTSFQSDTHLLASPACFLLGQVASDLVECSSRGLFRIGV